MARHPVVALHHVQVQARERLGAPLGLFRRLVGSEVGHESVARRLRPVPRHVERRRCASVGREHLDRVGAAFDLAERWVECEIPASRHVERDLALCVGDHARPVEAARAHAENSARTVVRRDAEGEALARTELRARGPDLERAHPARSPSSSARIRYAACDQSSGVATGPQRSSHTGSMLGA